MSSFFSKFSQTIKEKQEQEVQTPAAPTQKPPALKPAGQSVSQLLAQEEEEYNESRVIELADDCSLDNMLHATANEHASDLHLAPNQPPILRIHGDLVRTKSAKLTDERLKELLSPLITWDRQEKFLATGNLDFSFEGSEAGRFRANLYQEINGLSAAFRLIPNEIPTMEFLSLPKILKRIAMYRSGLVLVTGATGSGKSTTMASMIDYINKNRYSHIITIEDPIEFIHQNINCVVDHREIGSHARNFADAIKSAMREDPDIILVGEMRDLETMYQAIKAAETGVLVMATLHTNNAAKSIDRMINVFPAKQQDQIRSMISESLRAVISQQLLKRIDKDDRVAAMEILISSSGLGSAIRESKISQIPTLIHSGMKDGMQSMDRALIELYNGGKINLDTVKELVIDHTLLQNLAYRG